MAKAAKGKTTPKGDTRFKPGNDWWKKRTKHGIDKIFGTPEIMEEAIMEYFQHAMATEIKVGELTKHRPFSMNALCVFLRVNSRYFAQFEARIANNEIERGSDFSTVIQNAKEIINTEQFEGAVLGKYKENIIARKLGLHDTTNLNHSGAIDMPAPTINVLSAGVPLASKETDVEIPEDKKEGEV